MTPDTDLAVVRRAGRIAAVQASLALAGIPMVVVGAVASTADDAGDPPPGMQSF